MTPISQALKALLELRDMTETELMARAGVSPATVSHYLSGKRGVAMNTQAVKTVEKLAAALGVDPDHFIEYRVHRIAERLKANADLADAVYQWVLDKERESVPTHGTHDTGGRHE